jgi:hypothetical protein
MRSDAVNAREAGRLRLEQAIKSILDGLERRGSLLTSNAVVQRILLDEIRDGVNDKSIADDNEAGRYLEAVANTIKHAFDLGFMCGAHEPEQELYRQRERDRENARRGVEARKRKRELNTAPKWNDIANAIIDADGGVTGREKLRDKIAEELTKHGMARGGRTVLNRVDARRAELRRAPQQLPD